MAAVKKTFKFLLFFVILGALGAGGYYGYKYYTQDKLQLAGDKFISFCIAARELAISEKTAVSVIIYEHNGVQYIGSKMKGQKMPLWEKLPKEVKIAYVCRGTKEPFSKNTEEKFVSVFDKKEETVKLNNNTNNDDIEGSLPKNPIVIQLGKSKQQAQEEDESKPNPNESCWLGPYHYADDHFCVYGKKLMRGKFRFIGDSVDEPPSKKMYFFMFGKRGNIIGYGNIYLGAVYVNEIPEEGATITPIRSIKMAINQRTGRIKCLK